ncbi:DUF3413 domain-containing protein [Aliidiomarina haloalkalitolerans]|uniref:Alkaline phosphatase n=1 Tax=Aliidiomarina haloalkalitolerans TaxID=859059 RepID=A0A432VYE8_9GAMM|nr:DUF3413 domain-containing protein [Aliidiomarina haloalkalitolerans]MCL4409824.1 DUF3413 domain-containing protein [Gammaproteobacteria bacterium]RUO21605.1 alkaline phosphatase [Aliidiomarina haloalkalitolerans]
MGKYQQRDRIARLISWGHWFTFGNIFLCLLIGLLYVENALPTGSALGNSYIFISWLGHFAFLPFVAFIILLFPLCLIVPFSRFLRGYAATIGTIGLFTLLFDGIFFRQYGFHLNTYSLNQLALDAEEWFAGGSFLLLSLIILSFLLIFAVQLTLANIAWKRLDLLRDRSFAKVFTAVFIASFLASHSTHIWADANLYSPITQHDDLFPLSYPTTAKSLMARHGWITTEQFQGRQDLFSREAQLRVKYPTGPMLCSKESNSLSTTVFAFQHMDAETAAKLTASVPQLERHQGQHLAHVDSAAAITTLLYGIPDLYNQSIHRQGLLPAYLRTMQDFATPVRLLASPAFGRDSVPAVMQAETRSWTGALQPGLNVSVIFVTAADIDEVITYLEQVIESAQPVIITGLTAATENSNTIQPEVLNVPLWTANMDVYPRQLTTLEDIIPTVLTAYMSCAEQFRNFTNGISLTQPTREFPRVYTVRPYFYIFEQQQTTIIDANGDMLLFNQAGELVPGAVPPTPVFIQSLRELQRFADQ